MGITELQWRISESTITSCNIIYLKHEEVIARPQDNPISAGESHSNSANGWRQRKKITCKRKKTNSKKASLQRSLNI